MNIEAKQFEIKMTYGELWSLAFDVASAIKNTIQTHWINHQGNWKHNEKERLQILRDMFFALGRPDLYDEMYTFAEDEFKKFNAKNN